MKDLYACKGKSHTSKRSDHDLDHPDSVLAVVKRSVGKSRMIQIPPSTCVRKSRVIQVPPIKRNLNRADHVNQRFLCRERSTSSNADLI